MTIDKIIERREQLEKDLRIALSTMKHSNKILEIRQQIIDNQQQCPHCSDKYNWAIIDDTCPYCGFHFYKGRDY